jgi:hypothetical protein
MWAETVAFDPPDPGVTSITESVNERFYERVIKVKADVAAHTHAACEQSATTPELLPSIYSEETARSPKLLSHSACSTHNLVLALPKKWAATINHPTCEKSTMPNLQQASSGGYYRS